MKKNLIFICIVFLCAVCGVAQEFSSGDFSCMVQEEVLVITKYNGIEKNVIIPSSIAGYSVSAIGESAFSDSDIVTIVIPETVYYIDNYAFANCENLIYVGFKNFDVELGNNVFENCSKLVLQIENYSNIHIYAELNSLDYRLLFTMDDIITMVEEPFEEAVEIGSFIAMLSLAEEFNEMYKEDSKIPAQKEFSPESKPIYGWHEVPYISERTNDGSFVSVNIVLGYDSNNVEAKDEFKARKIEIQDYLENYFRKKNIDDLSVSNEENLKEEIRNGINNLCSDKIVLDVRLLNFSAY